MLIQTKVSDFSFLNRMTNLCRESVFFIDNKGNFKIHIYFLSSFRDFEDRGKSKSKKVETEVRLDNEAFGHCKQKRKRFSFSVPFCKNAISCFLAHIELPFTM
jgi:hypothetical protein